MMYGSMSHTTGYAERYHPPLGRRLKDGRSEGRTTRIIEDFVSERSRITASKQKKGDWVGCSRSGGTEPSRSDTSQSNGPSASALTALRINSSFLSHYPKLLTLSLFHSPLLIFRFIHFSSFLSSSTTTRGMEGFTPTTDLKELQSTMRAIEQACTSIQGANDNILEIKMRSIPNAEGKGFIYEDKGNTQIVRYVTLIGQGIINYIEKTLGKGFIYEDKGNTQIVGYVTLIGQGIINYIENALGKGFIYEDKGNTRIVGYVTLIGQGHQARDTPLQGIVLLLNKVLNISPDLIFDEVTKHIEMDCHFIKNWNLEILALDLSILFTKSLRGPNIENICSKLGVYNFSGCSYPDHALLKTCLTQGFEFLTSPSLWRSSRVATARFQAAAAIREAAIREWVVLSADAKRNLIWFSNFLFY
ncbi:hypothetical protein V8G54_032447 [Vigna mungo]|uniref:Uncharacterized protein n=1 Tax=Vigna mungo TaxID=3915 RepID=A0AAQ3MMX1_VIGMU